MSLDTASAENGAPLQVGAQRSALSVFAGFDASAASSGCVLPLTLGVAIALIAASWPVPENQGALTRWLFEIRASARG